VSAYQISPAALQYQPSHPYCIAAETLVFINITYNPLLKFITAQTMTQYSTHGQSAHRPPPPGLFSLPSATAARPALPPAART